MRNLVGAVLGRPERAPNLRTFSRSCVRPLASRMPTSLPGFWHRAAGKRSVLVTGVAVHRRPDRGSDTTASPSASVHFQRQPCETPVQNSSIDIVMARFRRDPGTNQPPSGSAKQCRQGPGRRQHIPQSIHSTNRLRTSRQRTHAVCSDCRQMSGCCVPGVRLSAPGALRQDRSENACGCSALGDPPSVRGAPPLNPWASDPFPVCLRYLVSPRSRPVSLGPLAA